MSEQISSSATFVTLFLLAIILLIAGRRILKTVLTPFLRVLSFFNRLLRRILGVFRSSARRAPAARPAQVSVAPLTALLHVVEMNSAAQIALGDVPKETVDLVHREGAFFRAVNADRVADSISDALTPQIASRNVELSEKYYAGDMTYDVSPSILYEVSEEELLIKILKNADLAFFYVLRRINKNVGRNVIRIVAVLTGMLVVFPYIATAAVAQIAKNGGWTGLNGLIYGLIFVSFMLGMVLFRWAYTNSTIKNGLHFNYFVSTYFSRLANQYKSAAAEFANVLNDRTLDLDTVEDESNVWFLNLQWLSSRQWFLELFVRNTLFQIGRNMWWYALVILVSIAGVWWLMQFGLPSLALRLHVDPNLVEPKLFWWLPEVSIPAAILFLIYLAALSGLLKRFEEQLGTAGWLDFRKMEIKEVIEKTVGALVREVVDKRRNPYGTAPATPRPPPPRAS